MDDEVLRLECLREARLVATHQRLNTDQLLELAKKLYDFAKGGKSA